MEKKLIAPHVTRLHRHNNLRRGIYAATVFLSLHYYFVIYINSSFLETVASPQFINVLYILGASLNLLLFFLMPAIIRKYGSFRVLCWLILTEMVAILGLACSESLPMVTAFFIIYCAMPALLWFSLDLYLERCSTAGVMGHVRGTYLTLGNSIVVISPVIVGAILANTNFQTIYLLSFLFLIPFLFIAVAEFKNIEEPKNNELHHKRSVRGLFIEREIGIVYISNLFLQIFYALMVIYMPIYLHNTIGIPWQDIGLIFTIMLLPFVLFELPLGRIADSRLGEKEILITGFLIIAASTLLIPFLSGTFFLPWAIILFVTRTGASFIEIASETYFFKKVRPYDANLISLYRSNSPLSYIIAPLIASIILIYFDLSALFTFLGILMIVGMIIATKLRDTR